MKSVISTLAAAAATLALAACSGGPSLPSLSTGSVSGDTAQPTQTATANAAATATPGAPAAPTAGTPIATPAAQPEPVKSTPTLRAYQVGTTSARAVKCGFYFDATQLKQQFLAAEAAQGTAIADMANVEKVYDIAFNGVTRGVQGQDGYCTAAKTKVIKEDLNRHLAGDYSPRPTEKVAKEEGGFFSSLFDGGDEVEKGPKIGTNEWWDSQRDKAGR